MSVLDEFLAHRQPIHFGGMSDPFGPAELRQRAALGLLKVLADYRYPTVISTKSDLFVHDEYLELLKRGKFLLQVSMSSTDDDLLRRVDSGTPGPSRMLCALDTARQEGIPTACRIQPILPTREKDAEEVVEATANVGVKHVSVEHLKLPIESEWDGTGRLSRILGVDLKSAYLARGFRIGREWILPASERIERTLQLREATHRQGQSFGAADNDLLLLSDGDCCDSGVGRFDGFSNFFRGTYPEAVRRGLAQNRITWRVLDETWCPTGSIARYVNSRSRLPSKGVTGAGMKSYLRANWNGRSNGNSPVLLHGVEATGDYDEDHMKIYRVNTSYRRMLMSFGRDARRPGMSGERNYSLSN
jgi:hypothetical protein